MPLYITKPTPASPEDFQTWLDFGYLGSWDHYLAVKATDSPEDRIFLHGDLGPHCYGCSAPSDVLCDYPVGDGKTCDRAMCREHAHHVGRDVDYCPDHFIAWNEYLASGRGYDVLANVQPIGDGKRTKGTP
jgi:hypothetical protein